MADDNQLITFSNLPLPEELCHVAVSIDHREIKDSSVKSDYQWQLLKTRILLFSDTNILASPMLGELRYIHVVCKLEYYTTGGLPALLERNRLKVEMISKLTLKIYEMCLMYHLITKLAPDWNRVEKLFIEGRYFLLEEAPLSALELHCIMSGDMLQLYINPLRLWLRTVDLSDFELPASILQHAAGEKFYQDLSLEPQWVHVLPSFKRGRLVYVTNYIPEKCTFANYQQMRRHWKNTYGFRLPDEDSSMIYVGVNFFGPLDFTYPLVCVRRGMHSNVGDPDMIYRFSSTLQKKASCICGVSLRLVNLGVPIHSHFMDEPEPREKKESYNNIEKCGLTKVLPSLERNELMNNTQISLCTQSQSNSELICTGSSNIPHNTNDEWFTKCSNFIEGLSQVEPKRSKLRAISKLVFTKNPRQFTKQIQKKPVFFNVDTTFDFKEKESDKEKIEGTQDLSEDMKDQELLKKEDRIKLIPNFQQNKLPISGTSTHIPYKQKNGSSAANLEGDVAGEKGTVHMLYKPNFNKILPKSSIKPIQPLQNKNIFEANSKTSERLYESNNLLPINTSFKPTFHRQSPLVKPSVPPRKPVSKPPSEKKPSEGKKQPTTFTENEIQHLYKSGKLKKVNTASLYTFLKQNGIQCKKNEKKQDLITKAELLLSQYTPKT